MNAQFMKKIRDGFFIFAAMAIVSLLPLRAGAFQIQKIAGAPAAGDFVLDATKVELQLDPGASASRVLFLTNRTGNDLNFSVSVEDFSASDKQDENIELLGAAAGSYSLKDFIKPEISSFTLKKGERISLPITVAIPPNAQPGGLYGAVIFSAQLPDNRSSSSNIRVIPRLASLFFVRVNGNVLESGALRDFAVSRSFSLGGPLAFEFNYKNSGSVYLNPYGELDITDIFGRKIYSRPIPPYFVMPGAIRQQIEPFETGARWGAYTATLKLNRGYGNQIDQKSLYFFILPWQYIVGIVAALILIAWLVWRISRRRKAEKIIG